VALPLLHRSDRRSDNDSFQGVAQQRARKTRRKLTPLNHRHASRGGAPAWHLPPFRDTHRLLYSAPRLAGTRACDKRHPRRILLLLLSCIFSSKPPAIHLPSPSFLWRQKRTRRKVEEDMPHALCYYKHHLHAS